MPNITKLDVKFAGNFDFLFFVELYRKLIAKFTVQSLRKQLTIFMEAESMERSVFLLGRNYENNLIAIRAAY